MEHQIRFPHLGIVLKNVGDGINIGGFEIKYYGMIIATGFLLGLIVSYYAAKHENKFDPELVFDYLITMIIPAIVGARLYYVIFSWDYYKNHLSEIIQIRNGGLAIYGGVIAGAITLYIFCKKKHLSMLQFGDVAARGFSQASGAMGSPSYSHVARLRIMAAKGLLVGQILGRWGNFFNREAFGSYTNSLFAMQIPTNFFIEHGRIDEIVSNGLYDKATYVISGNEAATFIQVHPTFLYESMWNLVLLLLIIFFFTKRKKFDGELIAIYCIGYGIGRFLIEGLRTDSLMIGSTGIRVSQILALILAVFGTAFIIYKRKKITK